MEYRSQTERSCGVCERPHVFKTLAGRLECDCKGLVCVACCYDTTTTRSWAEHARQVAGHSCPFRRNTGHDVVRLLSDSQMHALQRAAKCYRMDYATTLEQKLYTCENVCMQCIEKILQTKASRPSNSYCVVRRVHAQCWNALHTHLWNGAQTVKETLSIPWPDELVAIMNPSVSDIHRRAAALERLRKIRETGLVIWDPDAYSTEFDVVNTQRMAQAVLSSPAPLPRTAMKRSAYDAFLNCVNSTGTAIGTIGNDSAIDTSHLETYDDRLEWARKMFAQVRMDRCDSNGAGTHTDFDTETETDTDTDTDTETETDTNTESHIDLSQITRVRFMAAPNAHDRDGSVSIPAAPATPVPLSVESTEEENEVVSTEHQPPPPLSSPTPTPAIAPPLPTLPQPQPQPLSLPKPVVAQRVLSSHPVSMSQPQPQPQPQPSPTPVVQTVSVTPTTVNRPVFTPTATATATATASSATLVRSTTSFRSMLRESSGSTHHSNCHPPERRQQFGNHQFNLGGPQTEVMLV